MCFFFRMTCHQNDADAAVDRGARVVLVKEDGGGEADDARNLVGSETRCLERAARAFARSEDSSQFVCPLWPTYGVVSVWPVRLMRFGTEFR